MFSGPQEMQLQYRAQLMQVLLHKMKCNPDTAGWCSSRGRIMGLRLDDLKDCVDPILK